MASALVIGAHDPLRESIRRVLHRAGYDVVDAADSKTALRVLYSSPHHLVALLTDGQSELDVAGVLGTVAVEDRLLMQHAYILLAADPRAVSATIMHQSDELGVPIVATPAGEDDADTWADLLDAVALAARRFPDEGVH
jgi:hypothetical protein